MCALILPPADVDYESTICNLTFPIGSGPGTIRSCFIPILDDELMEDDETISIEGSTDTTVLPFTTTVVITDQEGAESDGPGKVALSYRTSCCELAIYACQLVIIMN